MDLQRLIGEVRARPAIWDQRNTHYHNREIILRLWGEIAKACDVSSDVAKSKWKHLRDNFRNELKKTYRTKPPYDGGGGASGDGSPPNVPEHESKWVWFKSLQFLRDQMNSRVIGGVCGHSSNGAGGFQTPLDETQIEPQIDIVEGEEEAHFDDIDGGESCNSLMVSDDAINQPGLPLRKRGKVGGRKRFLIDGMESVDCQPGIERKRYDRSYGRRFSVDDDDDDTYHFLMSVRSPMRSLPLERQMYVRLKIQEIILNEIRAAGQQDGRCQEGVGGLQDVKTLRGAPGKLAGNFSVAQNCSPERPIDNPYFS